MEKRKNRRLQSIGYALVVDELLNKAVVVLLVLIFVCQAVHILIPHAGRMLNTALSLEGEPLKEGDIYLYASGVPAVPWASLTLELLDYPSMPEVKVLVNGNEAGSFIQKEMTITIKHGDVVTVQNTRQDLSITVKVSNKTPNVVTPTENSMVTGKGILYLDAVTVK